MLSAWLCYMALEVRDPLSCKLHEHLLGRSLTNAGGVSNAAGASLSVKESFSTIRVFYVFSFGTRSVIELASILLVPRVLVKTVSPVEMSGENIVDYVLIVF